MDIDWKVKAACRDAPDTLFFAERSDHQSQIKAKTYCARCPVVSACLAYALAFKDIYGIWGNTTPKERRKMLKAAMQPLDEEMKGLSVTFVWVDELEASDG